MWFNQFTHMIDAAKPKPICKPFKNSHDEQIKRVTSFDWLGLSALYGVEEELRELIKDSPFIDEARCNAL